MDFLSGIPFISSIPFDWLLLGLIVIVVALDSLRSGVGRAIAISLALPIAFVLLSLAEKAVILQSVDVLFSTSFARALLFGALALALYFLIRRMGADYMNTGMGEPIQALFAGIAVAIVFTCIWLQVPALTDLWTIGGTLGVIFVEKFRLWWLIGAYAVLAFTRG